MYKGREMIKLPHPIVFMNQQELNEAETLLGMRFDMHGDKELLMWSDGEGLCRQSNTSGSWSEPRYLKLLQQSKCWSDIREDYVPKEFEFKYEEGNTYLINSCDIRGGTKGKYKERLTNGRYRKTEQSAERALKLQQRVMRLDALVDQFDGAMEWVEGEQNYSIYKDSAWHSSYASNCYVPERVYMTSKCAIKICQLLNDGLVSLEG